MAQALQLVRGSGPLRQPCYESAQQLRYYTPPSRRTWSKQHYRIRTPRPMVDRFRLENEHPEKEWWRERRLAPATFFGFPDVTKHGLSGANLYTEQMDAVTLGVLADKCGKENIVDPDIWRKFSWRAQQLAHQMHEPELCYVFRAFSRVNWYDQNLITTYLGRLHKRLPRFSLVDFAILLEAFWNDLFRPAKYLPWTLSYLELLLRHRDDATVEELSKVCAAIRGLKPLGANEHTKPVVAVLELLSEAMLRRDLSELKVGEAARIIDCLAAWDLVGDESISSSLAAADLCWALLRDLRGRVASHCREEPGDIALLALAMATRNLHYDDVWAELRGSLEQSAHLLAGADAANVAYAFAKKGDSSPKVFQKLFRQLDEKRSELQPMDCAKASSGFLRGFAALSEKAITNGPVFDRILELGLPNFDPAALSLLYDSLSRSKPGTRGVDAMASLVLAEAYPRMQEFSLPHVASMTRSLAHLKPDNKDVLQAVFGQACSAIEAQSSALTPRYLAMILRSISELSGQWESADGWLQQLVPHVTRSLDDNSRCAPITITQFILALVHCPGSEATQALEKCTDVLMKELRDLSAVSLVSLSEALAAHPNWLPPDAFLEQVAFFLNMKRYDLKASATQRAVNAFEKLRKGDMIVVE